MARDTGRGEVTSLEAGQPLACTTHFLLSNFDVDRHALKPRHQQFLRGYAHKILSNDSRTRMRVVGRASRAGADAHNQRLSESRAQEVVNYVKGFGLVTDQQFQSTAIGESAPFSTQNEAADDRSVEVHFDIPSEFIIALEDVGIVPRWREVEAAFRREFQPLAARAGRQLMLARRGPADIIVAFDRGGRETRPCAILILGNEGGGSVFVGAHKDLRVCGIPRLVDRRTGATNHGEQMQRVFEPDEPEFARFVANTAIHETGHVMGLSHNGIRSNYMFSVGSTGASLPREERTLVTMRNHWGGRKRFDPNQTRRLVCAIRSGFYPGGVSVQAAPNP